MQNLDGNYIPAGEKNLYMRIIGEGNPPVIIEPGIGGLAIEWLPIVEEISKDTSVILYDRAGYAESPKGKMPRTTKQICFELFDMLSNSGIFSPFIFVGNGYGGLVVQNFARMFPRECAGIILADSMSVKNEEIENLDVPTFQETASFASRIGCIRKLLEMKKEDFETLTTNILHNLYEHFPKTIAEMLFEYQTDKKLYETIIDEFDSLAESIEIINSIPDFPNIPLTVMCRDFKVMIYLSSQLGIPENEARAVEELWLAHNKSLTELSTLSNFQFISSSSQMIHLSRPDAIIQEIRNMLKSIKV